MAGPRRLWKRRTPRSLYSQRGDGYYLAGFGESGYVRKLKGFDAIARLVRSPSTPVSMAELVGTGGEERPCCDQRSRQETLDETATKQIGDELAELRRDYENAKADNNTVEMDLAQRQITGLESRLRTDIGLGWRSRDMNSEADKLRPKIYGVLRTAYKTLRQAMPLMNELANHFEGAISSESGCFIYRPAKPINWADVPPRKKLRRKITP